jgi:hypothetical protein
MPACSVQMMQPAITAQHTKETLTAQEREGKSNKAPTKLHALKQIINSLTSPLSNTTHSRRQAKSVRRIVSDVPQHISLRQRATVILSTVPQNGSALASLWVKPLIRTKVPVAVAAGQVSTPSDSH